MIFSICIFEIFQYIFIFMQNQGIFDHLLWRQKIYIQYLFDLLILILFFSHQLIREQWSQGSGIMVWSSWHFLNDVSSSLSLQSIIFILYTIKSVSNETDAFLIRYILIGMHNEQFPNLRIYPILIQLFTFFYSFDF